MALLKIAAVVAALYLIIVAIVALAQDWLLFPRWAMAGASESLPASAVRLDLKAVSGEQLVGVHLSARRREEGGALIVGFGGNAWQADSLAGFLHSVFPERDVVTFHYRGYAPSAGRPSAEALLQDALTVHDHLVATLAPDRIVAVGLSIGAGPAAHLASRRPIAGLILVTPFDSLEAVAREHYSWLPVGLLLRHRMEVAEALAASPVPSALIAAERDTIVPARRTDPLRKAARNLVLDRVIADADHNDLYARPEFGAAMRDALASIEGDDAVDSGP